MTQSVQYIYVDVLHRIILLQTQCKQLNMQTILAIEINGCAYLFADIFVYQRRNLNKLVFCHSTLQEQQ